MASEKIQLYSLATPNGMKVSIVRNSGAADMKLIRMRSYLDDQVTLLHLGPSMVSIALEEMGFEYDAHTINIMKGDQFTPEFIAVNPNSKIPALVDPNGPDGKSINIMESGAILMYLAAKKGDGKFLSSDPRLKWETIQWLFFQMGGVGPMFGQFGHFFKYAKDKCKDPYPVERYTTEAKRLLGVLETRLEGRDFIVDSGYSIADMAIFPWIHCLKEFYNGGEKLELSSFPKCMAYLERCKSRPATAKGMTVCKSN